MARMIACIVAGNGTVIAHNGVHDHDSLAAMVGLKPGDYLGFRYDLYLRKLKLVIRPSTLECHRSYFSAAEQFFHNCAGSPELLMDYVRRGNFDDTVLPLLLKGSARDEYSKRAMVAYGKFLAAHKMIDAHFGQKMELLPPPPESIEKIDSGRAAGDGASRAVKDARELANWMYLVERACIWYELFAVPGNRIDIWRTR